jgi:hypothetical protein
MAILIGATSSKTFADGFREGYKSIMGISAAIPEAPLQKGGKTVGSPI